MSSTNKTKILLIISALGIAVSLYLTYVKLTGSPIKCSVGSCDIVQRSKYAEIFGIPVALFGVLYYLTVAILAQYKATKMLKIVTSWGILFSGYLTYLELFVIHEICQWCVISAILATGAFVFSFIKGSASEQKQEV